MNTQTVTENPNEFLWVQKYRPKSVQETILPQKTKETFQKFVEQGRIPNFLFTGSPGIGKTTIAKALCEDLGMDYIVINGSLNGNIDTLRNEISNFASSMSFSGRPKCVILDEADYLNPTSTQPALRNFMEEFSANCGFILTANIKNKINPALQSRCSHIEFSIPNEEKVRIQADFFKRVCRILTMEGVEFKKEVVAQIVKNHFPDFRKTIGALQQASATGSVDEAVLVNIKAESVDTLFGLLREKDFKGVRAWVAENADRDANEIFRKLYDQSTTRVAEESRVGFILTISDHMFQHAFVADPEINLMACMLKLMIEVEFE